MYFYWELDHHLSGEEDGEDGERVPPLLGRVAVVLLTETEAALVPSLGHTAVVDQPQVDVDLVRAGSSEERAGNRYILETLSIISIDFLTRSWTLPNLLSRSPNILHELDAAALAFLHGRHVLDVPGVVEGVPAPLVPAAVAGEAVNVVPGCGKSQWALFSKS